MKLTKEFIKNEIKRLLSEVGGGYEGPVGFAGRPDKPSAETPTAPEATGKARNGASLCVRSYRHLQDALQNSRRL